MKWYFASRTRHKSKIGLLKKILEDNNNSVTFDWTSIDGFNPSIDDYRRYKKIFEKISKSVSDADIFVLISDSDGTDMFVELGIAINNHLNKNFPKKIYVVGKYNKRSLMHFHPSITHVSSIKDVFYREIPEVLNEEILDKINL